MEPPEDQGRPGDWAALAIFAVELSRYAAVGRPTSSRLLLRLIRPSSSPAAGAFLLVAISDLVVGEGDFTDDFTETAHAGGSPHPQLRSGDRRMLHPRSRRVRQTLQSAARSAWSGGD